VTARTSSIEALELFRGAPDDFDLLLTDMTMPKMTGLQLIRAVKKIRPRMPVMICTGYSEQIDEEKCRQLDIKGFVQKPVAKTILAQLVRKILDEAYGSNRRVN
jgi:CheY-like chemotaxis protein